MSQKRRALITGITGQDGALLAEFLINKVRQKNLWASCGSGSLPSV